MHCSEFLELYSDYRDGLLTDPGVVREVHQHIRTCRRCMDYDALVSRGVMALRATSDIRPCALSRRRLTRQLREAQRSGAVEPVRPAPAGIMAALMVAAAIALAVWPKEEPPLPTTNTPVVAAEPGRTSPSPVEPASVPNSELVTPAFREAWLAQPQREVTFETWVALSR